jgi:hypothetical protein
MKNIITSIEIVDRPTDPYRIVGILEELRRVWNIESKKTLGQIFYQIIDKEYELDYITEITDDELLAAIQNYE